MFVYHSVTHKLFSSPYYIDILWPKWLSFAFGFLFVLLHHFAWWSSSCSSLGMTHVTMVNFQWHQVHQRFDWVVIGCRGYVVLLFSPFFSCLSLDAVTRLESLFTCICISSLCWIIITQSSSLSLWSLLWSLHHRHHRFVNIWLWLWWLWLWWLLLWLGYWM